MKQLFVIMRGIKDDWLIVLILTVGIGIAV